MDWINLISMENYYYLWFGLGLIFLLTEMLGTGGYFLWTGLASILMAVFIFVVPFDISFSTQWIIYALVLVVNTYLWWVCYKKKRELSPQTTLNERSHQLLNKRGFLTERISGGVGRANFGDSSWRVSCNEPLNEGDEVVVIAVDGITLKIKKWQD